MADKLSKWAATLIVVVPQLIVPILFSEYNSWLHKQTTNAHAELWVTLTECNQIKEILTKLKLNCNK